MSEFSNRMKQWLQMKYPYGQDYFIRLFEDGWERRE